MTLADRIGHAPLAPTMLRIFRTQRKGVQLSPQAGKAFVEWIGR